MADEWAQNKIKDWTEKGMLSKEFILECIDKRIQEGYGISEKEESALARFFQSVCNEEGLLTEATFISLLETKATLRHSPEVIEAGKVLYASLAYLSTLPFPSKPQVATLPAGLSLAELSRSLVWAFPDRYTYLIEESNHTRLRTKADHRRLLFQSLASSTSDKPYNPESARRLAQFNAFDVDRGWYDPEMCISNHDDGGDEIYYDLLDLLYSRQEIKHVWLAGVPRDALRPVAKRLATESETPSLYALGIPTERFISIVKFLLALQFEPPETGVDLTGYDAAARSVCAAFCEEKEAVITWPMFDRGVREVTPYLFDPFYYMMSITYLGRPGFYGLCETLDPERAFGGILTPPLYCQLATFLAYCVVLSNLRRIHHYASPARLSPTEFVNAMETVPNKAIMVLSGTTSAGEACIFGVFSPKPTLDGTSVQHLARDHFGLQPCSIFQLAPVQGVFRGAIGKRGWTVDDDAVRFGQDGGVVLTLKDGLSRGDIIHQVSEEDWDIIHQVPKENGDIIHQVPEEDEDIIDQVPEEDGDIIDQVPEEDGDIIHQVPEEDCSTRVYKPNGWRGNWEVSFEISQIEIWSEEDSKVKQEESGA